MISINQISHQILNQKIDFWLRNLKKVKNLIGKSVKITKSHILTGKSLVILHPVHLAKECSTPRFKPPSKIKEDF